MIELRKRNVLFVILLISIVLLSQGISHAQSGGGFTIVRSTIDNGGRPVGNVGYRLNGTLGQFDAGTLAGGGFELTGGMWQAADTAPPTSVTLTNTTQAATPYFLLAICALALAFITLRLSLNHAPNSTSEPSNEA